MKHPIYLTWCTVVGVYLATANARGWSLWKQVTPSPQGLSSSGPNGFGPRFHK